MFRRPRTFLASIAIAVLLGSSLLAANAANAAEAQARPAAGTVQTVSGAHPVQLRLDCAHMTAKAHRYAVSHHYCTAAGKNVITPAGEVTGNCGSSFITLTNLGGGEAGIDWGFESSQGIVIQRVLTVSWNNLSMTGLHGSFPDDNVMFSADYENLTDVFSGHGVVHAQLTGNVLLIWGGVCTILGPQDVEIVT